MSDNPRKLRSVEKMVKEPAKRDYKSTGTVKAKESPAITKPDRRIVDSQQYEKYKELYPNFMNLIDFNAVPKSGEGMATGSDEHKSSSKTTVPSGGSEELDNHSAPGNQSASTSGAASGGLPPSGNTVASERKESSESEILTATQPMSYHPENEKQDTNVENVPKLMNTASSMSIDAHEDRKPNLDGLQASRNFHFGRGESPEVDENIDPTMARSYDPLYDTKLRLKTTKPSYEELEAHFKRAEDEDFVPNEFGINLADNVKVAAARKKAMDEAKEKAKEKGKEKEAIEDPFADWSDYEPEAQSPQRPVTPENRAPPAEFEITPPHLWHTLSTAYPRGRGMTPPPCGQGDPPEPRWDEELWDIGKQHVSKPPSLADQILTS
jgi:hypothetical protein